MSETDLQYGGGYVYQWECALLPALNHFFEPARYHPTLFDLIQDFLGEGGLAGSQPGFAARRRAVQISWFAVYCVGPNCRELCRNEILFEEKPDDHLKTSPFPNVARA